MRVRKSLSWTLVALYLALALLVPSLHSGEGLDHQGGAVGPGCAQCDAGRPILRAPCLRPGTCPNPAHHHDHDDGAGSRHAAAPCPRCTGATGIGVPSPAHVVLSTFDVTRTVRASETPRVHHRAVAPRAARSPPLSI